MATNYQAITPSPAPTPQPEVNSKIGRNRGDSIFVGITVVFACLIIGIVLIFGLQLVAGSWDALITTGLDFFTRFEWTINEQAEPPVFIFGALNFIYGTLLVSTIAVVLGGTISLGAAIFLSEYAPTWLRGPLGATIELLAAVPSVIYGFWGIQVLSPIMGGSVEPFLRGALGWLPMFNDKVLNTATNREQTLSFTGRDLLTAGLILSIMIIPIVTSISRDVIRTVPDSQREGMLAMGATRWQTITRAVLPYGKSGIVGALILGLGRAIGETVAMVFLVGGASSIYGPSASLFAKGETLASKISTSVGDAGLPQAFSAIMALGLVLFVITLVVNLVARRLVTGASANSARNSNKSKQTSPQALRTITNGFRQLIFPLTLLVLSPYLGLTLVVALLVGWAAIRSLRAYEIKLEGQNRKLPGLLGFISHPSRSYSYRKKIDRVMRVMLIGATAAAIIPLFSILLFVTVRGLPQVFEPGFIFNDGRPDVAGESLGLAHAILGTLIMTGIGAAIGIPIGLMAGIYLSEFGRGRFAGLVRFMADMLQGIPSIIVGIVVYQVIVRNRIFVDTGANVTAPQTGWAGGIALAIMIVPVITRTTEEILKLVPDSIREAGLALGVPKWKVTLTVILPAAFTGVVTGILLGVARIAGETAPLIFTAGLLNYFPSSIGQQTPALTTYIFQASRGAAQNEINQLWGAAFVLVFMIFGLTLAVRFFTRSRLKASL